MSLFICPSCGFTELPCWRTSNYRRYSVIARIDEIESFDRILAQQILDAKGKWIFIKPYWYKLSLKSGMVNRTTEGMGLSEWKLHGFTEKHRRKDRFQSRLFSGGLSTERSSEETHAT